MRASSSIVSLAKAASESSDGMCVAVTHSTFLRMLLAMALDVPLLEAAAFSVVNGGVSVIDVRHDLKIRPLGGDSRLFSGVLKQDIDIGIPVCHVIRINEARHLPIKPVLV
jgi:broad specificity phosphatase PhoE